MEHLSNSKQSPVSIYGNGYDFLDSNSNLDDEALGLLILDIVSATNLPFEESKLKEFNCDPFVICHFGKKSFRTKCINHNINPIWNESIYLNLKKEHLQNDLLINWKVFDYEFRSNDNILAQVDTAVQSLVEMCHKPTRKPGLITNFEPALYSIELTPKLDKKNLISNGVPNLNIKCSFLPYQGSNDNRFAKEFLESVIKSIC